MATGQLQAGVPSAIKREWMLPGDSLSDKAADTVVKEVKERRCDTVVLRKQLRAKISRLNDVIGQPGGEKMRSLRDLDLHIELNRCWLFQYP